MKQVHTHNNKQRRKLRTRGRIKATSDKPRMSAHRTNQHIYVQIIDDITAQTIAASSDKQLKPVKGTPVEIASLVGKDIAQKAQKAGIKQVIFDRGHFAYHGRIKAVAEAAREAGLKL